MLDIVLLVGKFIFLIVLYVFIFRMVRSTTRELRVSVPVANRQPWTPPGESSAAGTDQTDFAVPVGPPRDTTWALVVTQSPCIPVGAAYVLQPGAHALAGRSSEMDILLDDTFVSSKHALFEVTTDGLEVEDLRSTNGTQVNGGDIAAPTLLRAGDLVAVGDTVFRVEAR